MIYLEAVRKKLEKQNSLEKLDNQDQAQNKTTNQSPQKVESEPAKKENFEYSQEFQVETGPQDKAETSSQTEEKQNVNVEIHIPTKTKGEVRAHYVVQSTPIPTIPRKPPLATFNLALITITTTALYLQSWIRKSNEKKEDSFFIWRCLPYHGSISLREIQQLYPEGISWFKF